MDQHDNINFQEILDKVFSREIEGVFNEKTSKILYKTLENNMNKFDIEKKRKAAKSIEDLEKIHITN